MLIILDSSGCAWQFPEDMAKKKKATKKKSAKKKTKVSKAGKKAKTKKAKTTKSKMKAKTAKTTKSKKAAKKKAKKIAKVDTAKKRTPEEQAAVDQGAEKARQLLAEADPDILLEKTEAPPMDAECREPACDGETIIAGYCRLHYIKNWRKVKRKELILKEGKLNRYIEELVAKYPDKYIEAIRQDLASDKDFSKVISDLDLDESVDEFESENDSVDSLVGNIRRDLDDEGDSY